MKLSHALTTLLCSGALLAGCGPADIENIAQDETADFIPAYPGDDSASALTVGTVSSAITVNVPEGTPLRCTTAVNFRESPSLAGKLIQVIPSGTIVTKSAHAADSNGTNGYYVVIYKGVAGWVWGPSLLDSNSPLLAWGLHHNASDALRKAGVPASRIMQTIGGAPASAGTHLQDGTDAGDAYGAAVDISVSGMSDTEIHTLLSTLANVGYAGWYRNPGHDGWPRGEVRHLHAIYTDCAMKSSLDSQMRDWLVGRNGLASHTPYSFHQWSSAQKAIIRRNFEATN